MPNIVFKACAVTNEIDLNRIANQCGIPKKYTWEEPLILQGDTLGKIIGGKVTPFQKVLVFSFGSIVFVNTTASLIPKFVQYLQEFKPEISTHSWEQYIDDYELHTGETHEEIQEQVHEFELTDKYAAVPHFDFFYPELISIVLAKSVALEKIEEHLGKILDKLEMTIDRLARGNLRVSNKDLAKTTAHIVRHEYNTINYIMILDKPDITWSNSLAAEFYDRMAEFFELNDRYEILKEKTDILNHIVGGFSSISHAFHGLFVEWVMVVLIVLEVLLMGADLLR